MTRRNDAAATEMLKVRLTPAQLRRLDQEASERVLSRSAFVRLLLEDTWAKQDTQQEG